MNKFFICLLFNFSTMNHFLENPYYDFMINETYKYDIIGLHVFEHTQWYNLNVIEREKIIKKQNYECNNRNDDVYRIQLQYEIQNFYIIIICCSSKKSYIFDTHIDLKNRKQSFKRYECKHLGDIVNLSCSTAIHLARCIYNILEIVNVQKEHKFKEIFILEKGVTKLYINKNNKQVNKNSLKDIDNDNIFDNSFNLKIKKNIEDIKIEKNLSNDKIDYNNNEIKKNNVNSQKNNKDINDIKIEKILSNDKIGNTNEIKKNNKDIGKYIIIFIIFLLFLCIITGNILFLKKQNILKFINKN